MNPDDRTLDDSRSELSELEAIVNAGTWAMRRATGEQTWSQGTYRLLDLDLAIPASFDQLIACVHVDDRERFHRAFEEALIDREPLEITHRFVLADGSEKLVLHRIETTYDVTGAPDRSVGGIVDITRQQRTRLRLDDATARLIAVWEHAQDALFLADTGSAGLVDVNPRAEALTGRTRAELLGTTLLALSSPETVALARNVFAQSVDRPVRGVELEILTAQGDRLPVELASSGAFAVGPQHLVIASFRDISERKAAERAVARVTSTLHAIVRADGALVRAMSSADLMRETCEAFASRHPLVWIGVPVNDTARTVHVVAKAGSAYAYADDLDVRWSDEPEGMGPVGTSIKTGLPQVSRTTTSVAFRPWRDRAERFGLRSSLAVPIQKGGRAEAILVVYSAEPDAFGDEEVALFQTVAADIAFGLEALRTRERYAFAVEEERRRRAELEATLEGALSAIAAALEQRDPYTAGHQWRVAEFARRIAERLHVDPEQARGLYLASLVHEIGTIHIPTEILVKPSRLTPLEFALVKQHPEAGYQVLRNIPFRWPIAEIVRQHHEYLDGSGYPRGLKGDEILWEARVLTVADIVESMLSDRPYRPAPGLDAAVTELEVGRGARLDPAAVDVALTLLRRGEIGQGEGPGRQRWVPRNP